jgi:hypothetical protein
MAETGRAADCSRAATRMLPKPELRAGAQPDQKT